MIIKEIMVSSSPCDLGPPKQNSPPIVNYHNMTGGSSYSWIKSIVDLLYQNQATYIRCNQPFLEEEKKSFRWLQYIYWYHFIIHKMLLHSFGPSTKSPMSSNSNSPFPCKSKVKGEVMSSRKKKKWIWVTWWLTQTWTQLLLLKKPLCNTYAAWSQTPS